MQNKFNEVANKITTIKTGFADAITAKGVETLPSSSFGDMITNIGKISGGGDTDKPEEPGKEWVKPHDWIDIEAEPLEPNEIRVLFSDVSSAGQGFYFSNKNIGGNLKCSIDWGDGSPIEEVNSKSDISITHKYKKGTGTPCDRGYTMFVVKIKNLYNVSSFYIDCEDVNMREVCSNLLWFYGDLSFIKSLKKFCCKDNSRYTVKTTLVERINITNTDECESFEYCFKDAISLESVKLPFNNKSTNFIAMFYNCHSLNEVSLIDTSIGTSLHSMFYGCHALKEIPLIDTSSNAHFTNMFYDCHALNKIPALNTSKGERFSYMFYDCHALNEIPTLDTSKGTDFSYMFYGCYSLNEIHSLDISNGSNFDNMFSGCINLKHITGIIGIMRKNVSNIFYGCKTLKKTPPIDTTGSNSSSSHFDRCMSLIDVGDIKLSNNIAISIETSPLMNINFSYDTDTPPMFANTTPIRIKNSPLNKEDLNKLMTQLPDGNGKTLDIMGNIGTQTCDTSIATSKNWTVLI